MIVTAPLVTVKLSDEKEAIPLLDVVASSPETVTVPEEYDASIPSPSATITHLNSDPVPVSSAIVIEPSALVTSIPSPAVKVASSISPFEPLPTSNSPAAGAEPSIDVIEPLNARPVPSMPPNATLPALPEKTDDVSVASW